MRDRPYYGEIIFSRTALSKWVRLGGRDHGTQSSLARARGLDIYRVSAPRIPPLAGAVRARRPRPRGCERQSVLHRRKGR